MQIHETSKKLADNDSVAQKDFSLKYMYPVGLLTLPSLKISFV